MTEDARKEGVFVLSSGRCGSTLLSNMLRKHHEILSLSEFLTVTGAARVFGAGEMDGRELWQLLSRPDPDFAAHLEAARVPEVLSPLRDPLPSPLLLIPLPHLTRRPVELLTRIADEVVAYPRAPVAAQLRRLFAWLARGLDKRVWVERSGGSLEYAQDIQQHFPRARFVCLFRDGADTALSMAQHPFFRVRVARILQHDRTLPVAACLASEVPLDRFAAYWSALMIRTKRFIDALPSERVHMVAYEELVHEPAYHLRQLADFLGLAAPPQWLESSAAMTAGPASRSREQSPASRRAVERACRPGQRALATLLGRATSHRPKTNSAGPSQLDCGT